MDTDQAIYQYLSIDVEALRVLTNGIRLPRDYQFKSLTFKSLERRVDAVFTPKSAEGTAYLVEFQAQWSATIWYNLIVKMGLYGEEHPHQQVHGILIFLKRTNEATYTRDLKNEYSSCIQVIYLEDFLPKLLDQEPNNPFVAIFAPLLLKSDAELERQAPKLWQTVQNAEVETTQKQRLQQILEFWFLERFKTKKEEEIFAMFQTLTPLEETLAYKNIFAKGMIAGKVEGKAEGKAEGKTEGEAFGIIKGEALLLKRHIMRKFRKLPKWVEQRIDKADSTQLEAWDEKIFDVKTLKQLFEDTK